MGEYFFHPLTSEIKEHFAKERDNDFVKRLNALTEIERVDVFPDEQDDAEVIVIFKAKVGVTCIVFSDGLAWLEYSFNKCFFNVPFYYEAQTEKGSGRELHNSIYKGYAEKGMNNLFEDIFKLIENIAGQKIYIEYVSGLKALFNKGTMFEKSRVYLLPNDTVAFSKKWSDAQGSTTKKMCLQL